MRVQRDPGLVALVDRCARVLNDARIAGREPDQQQLWCSPGTGNQAAAGTTEAGTAQPSPGVAAADSAGGSSGIRQQAVVGCDPRHRGGAGELIREKR